MHYLKTTFFLKIDRKYKNLAHSRSNVYHRKFDQIFYSKQSTILNVAVIAIACRSASHLDELPSVPHEWGTCNFVRDYVTYC